MMRDVDCCVSMKFRYIWNRKCAVVDFWYWEAPASLRESLSFMEISFSFFSPLPSWFNCRIDGVLSLFSVRSVKNSEKRNAKYQSNYQNRQSLFPCFIKWITRHSWNLRCVIQPAKEAERALVRSPSHELLIKDRRLNVLRDSTQCPS